MGTVPLFLQTTLLEGPAKLRPNFYLVNMILLISYHLCIRDPYTLADCALRSRSGHSTAHEPPLDGFAGRSSRDYGWWITTCVVQSFKSAASDVTAAVVAVSLVSSGVESTPRKPEMTRLQAGCGTSTLIIQWTLYKHRASCCAINLCRHGNNSVTVVTTSVTNVNLTTDTDVINREHRPDLYSHFC